MNKQVHTSLPNAKELLELEAIARNQGSGIGLDSLFGLWNFVSVWKKGNDKEDFLSSSILRILLASLELRENQVKSEIMPISIVNSVKFGYLVLKFTGLGEISGSQPLLPFCFDRVEVTLASKTLFSRSIDVIDSEKRPFYALIGVGSKGQWLAARGRGGGLALWLRAN